MDPKCFLYTYKQICESEQKVEYAMNYTQQGAQQTKPIVLLKRRYEKMVM